MSEIALQLVGLKQFETIRLILYGRNEGWLFFNKTNIDLAKDIKYKGKNINGQ